MTLQPKPYSDLSSPVTAAATPVTPARQFTEPLRELSALALLLANAVHLFLGLSGLFFVLDRWASDFGLRCAAVFDAFVGPLSLGLPMLALLLATHVAPMVGRVRLVLIGVLAEYGASALFGAVTFLGAFAHDLSSVRATLEGLLERSMWSALLVLATVIAVRVWMGLFPAPKRPYAAYPRMTYGKPYPGQPMYPQPTFRPNPTQPNPTQPGSPHPGLADPGSLRAGDAQSASPPMGAVASPPVGIVQPGLPRLDAQLGLDSPSETTASSGWPAVPPPPMPAPLVIDHVATVRVATPSPAESAGGATRLVPPPEPPTQQTRLPDRG